MNTNVIYSECYVFSSSAMRCPMCKVLVPANTEHTCSNGVSADSAAAAVRDAFKPIVQRRKQKP